MKSPLTWLLCSLFTMSAFAADSGSVLNLADRGGVGDGRTSNTKAINAAIAACAAKGGGTVVIPKGTFLTSTVELKSNVNLFLARGAVLLGSPDTESYKNYSPTKNLDYLNTGGTGRNANNMNDARWTRALVLGVGVSNVTISGEGILDGQHVFDPKGEENMRGPHCVLLAESRNVTVSGITVNRAANYAVTAYDVANLVFQNLTINEGWDGIHIRGGTNILIRNCEFHTGDDAIAGGYWRNMVVTDCLINSACNGMRVIQPVNGFEVTRCLFAGPGKYPHRTSGAAHRNNMGNGIIVEPGGWGDNPGDIENIRIHDNAMDNLDNSLAFVLYDHNNARNILVENLKATRLNGGTMATESRKGGVFDDLVFRNIDLSYSGQPEGRGRSWGFQLQHVVHATIENMKLRTAIEEKRPVFCFDTVFDVKMKNVSYPETPGVDPFLLINTGKLDIEK